MRSSLDRLGPRTVVLWAQGTSLEAADAALRALRRPRPASAEELRAARELTGPGSELGDLRRSGLPDDLVDALVRAKVLTASVPVPERLFDLPMPPPPPSVPPECFLLPERYEEYKRQVAARLESGTPARPLRVSAPAVAAGRRSVRVFAPDPVAQDAFEAVLAAFTRRPDGTFAYGSAGALYPLDVYAHVKAGRVAGWDEGLYRVRPLSALVDLVSGTCVFPESMHLPGNREIFATSAFSLFWVFDPRVSGPKYGGRAYYYGILEAGAMAHHAGLAGAAVGLGSCQIGALRFEVVEKYFRLDPAHLLLHSLEFGLPADNALPPTPGSE